VGFGFFFGLAVDEVDDVGWSMFRMTILAAARLAPDLMTPAKRRSLS